MPRSLRSKELESGLGRLGPKSIHIEWLLRPPSYILKMEEMKGLWIKTRRGLISIRQILRCGAVICTAETISCIRVDILLVKIKEETISSSPATVRKFETRAQLRCGAQSALTLTSSPTLASGRLLLPVVEASANDEAAKENWLITLDF